LFIKTTLNNGVRIVSQQIPHVNSAALGIWVKAGSRNESENEHGISHFIEHLQFKGTNKRTALEISDTFERVGGQINAFTTKEYTCFLVKVLSENFFYAADVLCDMFFNSKYDTRDIENEKGVIIEEIRSIEDIPDEIVHDYFAKAFWNDHPLGRPILGTVETVSGFTREAIIDYLEREYVANNIVVAAAGKIVHDEIVDRLGPLFEKYVPAGGECKYTAPQTNPGIVIRQKASEQVQVCLGTPGLSHTDENLYALTVLNNILGGGLSSRLFQEVREKRGLVYSIYSYNVSFFDCGLWCIHAGTSSENVVSVLKLCLNTISDIKRDGVSVSELHRAKQQIRGELLLSMENTTNHMSRLGRTELTYGRVVTVEEMVDKVMKVTLDQVHELARKLFLTQNFGLAVIGSYKENINLKEIIEEARLE